MTAMSTPSLPGAAKALEAVYEVPYLAHATMEPLNATAHWQSDRLDLWVGTQMANVTLAVMAKITQLKPEQVHVHNAFLGGGFGRSRRHRRRRAGGDVSKAVGKPVKVIWTREDDMRHDRYRPQAAIRFRGGLAADGTPVALAMKTVVGSLLRSNGISKVENGIEPMAVDGLANTPYKIPNLQVQCVLKNTHGPVSFWRSVGASQNAFFIESFIDELAHAAGTDPVAFRRSLLKDRADWTKVLDTLAEHSNWGSPLPAGVGRGIGMVECFGSVVGTVAEVAVSPEGQVKVQRVVYAVDCGHPVNPLTIAEQLEGGTIFGLTAALCSGKITIKDGAVEQGNFDSYQMVRLAQAPKIEVHIANTGGKKWGGVGEPGTAPIAPAVANAIFAVTGKRIRSLPLMDHDLSGVRTRHKSVIPGQNFHLGRHRSP